MLGNLELEGDDIVAPINIVGNQPVIQNDIDVILPGFKLRHEEVERRLTAVGGHITRSHNTFVPAAGRIHHIVVAGFVIDADFVVEIGVPRRPSDIDVFFTDVPEGHGHAGIVRVLNAAAVDIQNFTGVLIDSREAGNGHGKVRTMSADAETDFAVVVVIVGFVNRSAAVELNLNGVVPHGQTRQ